MNAFTCQAPGTDTLQLSGAIGIYSAQELQTLLIDEFSKRPALHLDLSQIEACDVAALQLLYAAKKMAAAAGKPFRIERGSEIIDRVCRSIGLEPSEL